MTTGHNQAVIEIRRAGEDDWAALREVRLAALADAPEAFSSTYAREVAFDEAAWRERLTRLGRATFFAQVSDGGPVIGMVAGKRGPHGPADDRELVSMWVNPSMRGQGVAGPLIDAVADWAREQGARTLSLWVLGDNVPAQIAYARAGFTPTGQRQPISDGGRLSEACMIRPL